MKKIFLLACISFSFVSLIMLKPFSEGNHKKKSSKGEAEESQGRDQWELKRLADPASGRIPFNMRELELAFAATLPKLQNNDPSLRSTGTFSFRGPSNLGGRTRGLAVDIANENIILAGSVNGGVWRSANGGATWSKVSTLTGNQSVSWIAQDKRPGKTNIWYYSSGEATGTSASGAGAFYLGTGVFKSIDNGLTWNVLSSTNSNTAAVFDNVWDVTWKVATDPSDTVNNVVYAATYGAIFRSTNGGTSWTIQKGNSSGSFFSYYTDVDVTTSGIAYAVLSSDGPSKGVWRRSGTTWTSINPPGWDTATYNRVVIGVNPSNENEVYFLGETPYSGKVTTNYKGDIEYISLWKYTYVSGTGVGAGGIWTDLSQNIPYDGSQFGNFNCQGGYDLIVRVHPTDSNTVFIGGTNLYRSSDGFATSANITFMGGYDPLSTLPMYGVYPGHHSDQHNMVFLPSNPDVMYQANDGGIYMTSDCRAANVVWQDLNTSYLTGQFYTIALDHATPNDNIIIGGAQDYGTWYTNSTNNQLPWAHPGLGDGAFCAVDNGHQYYYMSRQQGKLMKCILDNSGNVTAYNRIDPIDTADYLFINPFVLDPNNNDIMYWAAKNRIWRNDALTSIPLTGQWDSISTGWTVMPVTIADSINVTAFGISTVPANRLYFGTDLKSVYRVDNANNVSPTVTNITSTLFPAAGYVNCIAVDPLNADHILVVYSNYQIYSLFESRDAGATYTKCAGNLEVNSTGAGNGPSLRWASIVPVANGYVYLVATSTGVYGTNLLNGLITVWTQLSIGEIGSLVSDMMDFRASDGRVVIATHGGGIFSTTIADTLTTGISIQQFLSNVSVFPNPTHEQLHIKLNGIVSGHSCQIKLFNSAGAIVRENKDVKSEYLDWNVSSLSSGIYYLSVEADGKRTACKVIVD